MQIHNNIIHLSASDLVGHLNCHHLTSLDLAVASGALTKPKRWDPLLEILRERGHRHETAFLEHLKQQGFGAVAITGIDITPDSIGQTTAAMAAGSEIIIQAALRHGRWSGRADVLRRVERPSTLGAWSYEVIDTKLARETKGGTVLQLCLYADLLAEAQGNAPEYVYVVAPWSNFEPQSFRVADYAAYFRRAKAAIEAGTDGTAAPEVYPDTSAHRG
jgi:predicted RecB family nuclease